MMPDEIEYKGKIKPDETAGQVFERRRRAKERRLKKKLKALEKSMLRDIEMVYRQTKQPVRQSLVSARYNSLLRHSKHCTSEIIEMMADACAIKILVTDQLRRLIIPGKVWNKLPRNAQKELEKRILTNYNYGGKFYDKPGRPVKKKLRKKKILKPGKLVPLKYQAEIQPLPPIDTSDYDL